MVAVETFVYPDLPTEPPAQVVVSGPAMLAIVVDLLRAKDKLLEESGRIETEGIEMLEDATNWIYTTGFGPMFCDSDPRLPELPDDEAVAPLYRLAEQRASGPQEPAFGEAVPSA